MSASDQRSAISGRRSDRKRVAKATSHLSMPRRWLAVDCGLAIADSLLAGGNLGHARRVLLRVAGHLRSLAEEAKR